MGILLVVGSVDGSAVGLVVGIVGSSVGDSVVGFATNTKVGSDVVGLFEGSAVRLMVFVLVHQIHIVY